MNKVDKSFLDISLRYALLLIIAILNFSIFYFLFTTITIYSVYGILGLFFPVSLSGNSIFLNEEIFVSIIPACVAGAAYYILSILLFSTLGIPILKRGLLILIAFFSFLVINIFRIVLLSFLYFYNSPLFDVAHQFLWYFGGIVLTIGIWFLEVYFFKIKGIPFYSDLKFVYERSLFYRR